MSNTGKWQRDVEDQMMICAGRLNIHIDILRRRLEDETWHCGACKQWKPFSQFGKSKYGFTRLDTTCKACNRDKAREHWRKAHGFYTDAGQNAKESWGA